MAFASLRVERISATRAVLHVTAVPVGPPTPTPLRLDNSILMVLVFSLITFTWSSNDDHTTARSARWDDCIR
jgi:hypothetical protein